METVINPYRELTADITPTDFEKFCMETLRAYAKEQSLPDFEIKHNQKIETHDGTYQIDILAEYTALGCKNIVIAECKKYTRSIERKLVTELYAKIQSIGAQKGILMSTSGFQSGAVQFAKEHGIALWQIVNHEIRHFAASGNPIIPEHMLYQIELEKHLPKYMVMEWDCASDYPYHEIYPTQEMYETARKKARESLQNRRNING